MKIRLLLNKIHRYYYHYGIPTDRKLIMARFNSAEDEAKCIHEEQRWGGV